MTGVSKSTVFEVRKRNNLEVSGNCGGRPRLLTDHDARHMERLLRKSSKLRPKEASQVINKPTSEWTARRALKKIRLVASLKKKKPALSKKNISARLEFCREHAKWSVEDWKRVIWTDETKINRYLSDGKSYYWHRPQEQLQPHQVKQTMKHGGRGSMIWGCITWWQAGPILKIEGIMNKEYYLNILKTYLPDFIDKCAYPIEEIVFQQDGDPKHTAKIVKEWLENQQFQTLKWPAQSPDLYPIENLWAIVKRSLSGHDHPTKTLNELWERVKAAWSNIPHSILENLVKSMPKCVNSVIRRKGLWSKY